MSSIVTIYLALGSLMFHWPLLFLWWYSGRGFKREDAIDWALILTLGSVLWPIYTWRMWRHIDGDFKSSEEAR